MTDRDLAERLGILARKAAELESRARQLSLEDDETLWMSSLDIIDEILDEIRTLRPPDGSQPAAVSHAHMLCPHCHASVAISPDAVISAAIVCPACGDNILLSNPT